VSVTDVTTFSKRQADEWLAKSNNASEWTRLQGVLSLTDGFAFLAVHAEDEAAERLVGQLLARNGKSQGIDVHGFELGSPRPGGPVVTRLLHDLRGASRPCWFFLRGGPHARQNEAELGRSCLLLNQKRDVITQQADAPFILALHPQDWNLFRRNAPDFWSIHQAVFRFGPAVGMSDGNLAASFDPEADERDSDSSSQRPVPSGWRLAPASLTDGPNLFVARESERRYLSAKLREMGARLLVRGIGGTGKTTLVRLVVTDLFDRYDEGIWWIPFGTLSGTQDDRATTALGRLIADLLPRTQVLPGLSERATLFRHVTEERRMLFVFDDVDDASLFRWFVPGRTASVCVITRAAAPVLGFEDLNLNALSREESQRLLRSLYPRLPDELNAEVAAASRGVPLVLQLLGAYVERSPDPNERMRNVLSRLGSTPRSADSNSTLLSSLLDGVLSESISPAAASIWPTLGLFEGRFTVDDVAVLSQTSADGVKALLNELAGVGLVNRTTAEDEFELHPGLQLAAHLRLDPDRAFELEERFLQRAGTSGRIETSRVGDVWVSLLARSLNRDDDVEIDSLLRRLESLLSYADPAQSAAIADSVAQAAEARHDPRLERLAVRGLMLALSSAERFEEALAAGKRLISLAERDAPNELLDVYILTAKAARLSGRAAEAESILSEVWKRADVPSEFEARAFVEAARISMALGKFVQAEMEATEAVRLTGPAASPAIYLEALATLGELASRSGRAEKALEVWSKVAQVAEHAKQPVWVRRALFGLARAQESTGQLDAASATYSQAGRVAEATGSRGALADAEYALGRLEIARGNFRSALQYFDRASQSYEALSQASSAKSVMWARATTLNRLGDRSGAIETATHLLAQEAGDESEASRIRALLATLVYPDSSEAALAYVRAMVDAFSRASASARLEHGEVLIWATRVFINAGMRDAALLLLDALLGRLRGDDADELRMRLQAHAFKISILGAGGDQEAIDRYIALARDELVAFGGDSRVDEFVARLREAARSGARELGGGG
jgi:tetratricopeptide (TPR) repeat protein